LGRFISRDPIGYEGSRWSLYEYVASKPVSGVDPSGKRGLGMNIGGHITASPPWGPPLEFASIFDLTSEIEISSLGGFSVLPTYDEIVRPFEHIVIPSDDDDNPGNGWDLSDPTSPKLRIDQMTIQFDIDIDAPDFSFSDRTIGGINVGGSVRITGFGDPGPSELPGLDGTEQQGELDPFDVLKVLYDGLK